jgi:hypothetical protein
MRGAIPPLPQYVFMAWCLVKHWDSFTFLSYLMDLRESGLEVVNLMHLAQDGDQWRNVVNTVFIKGEEFFD